MPSRVYSISDKELEDVLIEKFLIEIAHLGPRSALKVAFQEENVLLNGRPANRLAKIKMGDRIEVRDEKLFKPEELKVIANKEIQFEPLVENDLLIIMNKPSGMNVHPLHPSEDDTALNLFAGRSEKASEIYDEKHPLEGGLAHRIDRGTSGILVCAKDKDMLERLRTRWTDDQTQKVYITWVRGKFDKPKNGVFSVECWMTHDSKNKKRMKVSQSKPKGNSVWEAKTKIYPFKTIEIKSTNSKDPSQFFTLVLVRIHTGVTHQIRATLASLGYPVVGDVTYDSISKNTIGKVDLNKIDDEETESLFEQLIEDIPFTDGPKISKLPENGFFLHAFWLQIPLVEGLYDGIIASLPVYF